MQRYNYFSKPANFSQENFPENEKFSHFMTMRKLIYLIIYKGELLSLSEYTKQVDEQINKIKIERQRTQQS